MDDFWDNTPDLDLPETQGCQKKRSWFPEYQKWFTTTNHAALNAEVSRSRFFTRRSQSDTISARIAAITSKVWRLITRLKRIKNRWRRKLNHRKNKRI